MNSIKTQAWAAGLKLVYSKCEFCHRSMALRNFSARKAGIRMRNCWYCSSDCFTSAAQEEFSRLLPSRFDHGSHFARMPLGLSLISRGLITETQFREATDKQKEAGGEIGELLVRHGSVSEKQVTEVRAAQWHCPVFAVPGPLMQTGIHIPSALMRRYSAIPLHYVAATKLLLVGFVHGIEYTLLFAIEQITGCKTQACFVTPSDFEAQMLQIERERLEGCSSREVSFEAAQTSAEMASTLCNFGVDLEADEAMIGRLKEYVWARLKSGAKNVDLLFKLG
jgi:hypothetical protein